MKTQRLAGWIVALAAIAAALAGCERAEDPELGWARAALERNPDLEIVAVDSARRMFTVRDKVADQLYTVAVNDIVAGPEATMRSASRASAAAASVSDEVPAQPAPATPQAGTASPAASPEQANPAAEAVAAAAAPSDSTLAAAGRTPAYTVERSDGKVRVSGPGFSIVSADSKGSDVELAARAARRDAPIICEGSRMMHIDDRTLDVDGDAIIARDGCDLYLTNSHIRASGIAVTATRARVHIANSTVEGGARSLEVGDGGEAFLRNSTLDGVTSRLGSAQFHDLGGNRWE